MRIRTLIQAYSAACYPNPLTQRRADPFGLMFGLMLAQLFSLSLWMYFSTSPASTFARERRPVAKSLFGVTVLRDKHRLPAHRGISSATCAIPQAYSRTQAGNDE